MQLWVDIIQLQKAVKRQLSCRALSHTNIYVRAFSQVSTEMRVLQNMPPYGKMPNLDFAHTKVVTWCNVFKPVAHLVTWTATVCRRVHTKCAARSHKSVVSSRVGQDCGLDRSKRAGVRELLLSIMCF